MREIRLILSLAFAIVCLFSSAQSMQMVVDKQGAVVGRWVKTNNTTYTVLVQDDTEVPIKGHRIVTYSAKNGQGVLYRDQKRTGKINVRKGASTKTAVIAQIEDNTIDGYVPECYDCLGLVNGWYKIRINGKTGYVRADLMEWDGMCSF